jgi:hypothetical protein
MNESLDINRGFFFIEFFENNFEPLCNLFKILTTFKIETRTAMHIT